MDPDPEGPKTYGTGSATLQLPFKEKNNAQSAGKPYLAAGLSARMARMAASALASSLQASTTSQP
jgi:hypothetical protein